MDRTHRLNHARKLKHDSEELFRAAHETGMAALDRHDYAAFGEAISDESTAIKQYRSAIGQLRDPVSDSVKQDDDTATKCREDSH
jgi:hypothetical protein